MDQPAPLLDTTQLAIALLHKYFVEAVVAASSFVSICPPYADRPVDLSIMERSARSLLLVFISEPCAFYVYSHLFQVDHLMALLPGVNVTNVISNAPGVLVRGVSSLPAKVWFQPRVDAPICTQSWWLV